MTKNKRTENLRASLVLERRPLIWVKCRRAYLPIDDDRILDASEGPFGDLHTFDCPFCGKLHRDALILL